MTPSKRRTLAMEGAKRVDARNRPIGSTQAAKGEVKRSERPLEASRQKKTTPSKGWAARKRQRSDRPVFRKRQVCQMNLLQALPAGANRVASITAASLNGSKGVLDPKAQVHARRGVTL